jgi:hypothetical protein
MEKSQNATDFNEKDFDSDIDNPGFVSVGPHH